MGDSPHDLLLALAGRVDDDLLAWCRELVAVGEDDHALDLLAATLIADGTALDAGTRAGLVAATRAARSDLDVDALFAPAADALADHRFDAGLPLVDRLADVVAGLPARQVDGCRLYVTARTTPAGSAPGPLPHPVVLAQIAADDPRPVDVLADQLALACVRAGLVAAVEVIVDGTETPRYQRSALAASRPVAADAQPEPARFEPARFEPAQFEPAQFEPAQPQPAELQAAPARPAQLQSAPAEPTRSEPARTGLAHRMAAWDAVDPVEAPGPAADPWAALAPADGPDSRDRSLADRAPTGREAAGRNGDAGRPEEPRGGTDGDRGGAGRDPVGPGSTADSVAADRDGRPARPDPAGRDATVRATVATNGIGRGSAARNGAPADAAARGAVHGAAEANGAATGPTDPDAAATVPAAGDPGFPPASSVDPSAPAPSTRPAPTPTSAPDAEPVSGPGTAPTPDLTFGFAPGRGVGSASSHALRTDQAPRPASAGPPRDPAAGSAPEPAEAPVAPVTPLRPDPEPARRAPLRPLPRPAAGQHVRRAGRPLSPVGEPPRDAEVRPLRPALPPSDIPALAALNDPLAAPVEPSVPAPDPAIDQDDPLGLGRHPLSSEEPRPPTPDAWLVDWITGDWAMPAPPEQAPEPSGPAPAARLSDADRELLSRLQSELGDTPRPRVTRRAGIAGRPNGRAPSPGPPDLAG